MQQIRNFIQQMINISEIELDNFLEQAYIKKIKRLAFTSQPNTVPNEIFFINKGLMRVLVTDPHGVDHTVHFALENQFIADYSCFIQKKESLYSLQTLEETEVVILPRSSIEWGYLNLREGQKMGRLIAEYYFIYQDDRIKNLYTTTPKQRYDNISGLFPKIHERVPQHMIASYLGMTLETLSRVRKKYQG